MGLPFNILYREFLAEVGKHRVGTILPSDFAILFNQAQEEVVTNKLAAIEINKKAVEDLLPLDHKSSFVMSVNDTELTKCFSVERPLNVRRIKNIRLLLDDLHNSRCVFLASNLKSDKLNGVYSKPTVRNCYYDFKNESDKVMINVYVPQITTSCELYLDYYKEPIRQDAQSVVSDSLCLFNNEMCIEIINVAARMCIERKQDARFQTFSLDLKNKNTNQ